MVDHNLAKPKRTYDSTRRRAQASVTRRQIADAARVLLVQRGYAGATIEAIAQHAGVATETVYSIFGSKASLLSHLVDIAVGGDDTDVRLLDRPGPQAAIAAADQRTQLHIFATGIAEILARVAPLFLVMRVASQTEPEIAALLQSRLAQRHSNLEVFAEHLAANGPLRQQAIAPAVDTVWAMTSPELYRLVTADLGWSHNDYVVWLEDTLVRLLLPNTY